MSNGSLALLLGMMVSAAPAPAAAPQPSPDQGYALVRQLMSQQRGERREAEQQLLAAGDATLVPALVDALFYTPKLARAEMLSVLRKLAGEDAGKDYYDWVELVGRRTELTGRPGYMEWKLSLLSRID